MQLLLIKEIDVSEILLKKSSSVSSNGEKKWKIRKNIKVLLNLTFWRSDKIYDWKHKQNCCKHNFKLHFEYSTFLFLQNTHMLDMIGLRKIIKWMATSQSHFIRMRGWGVQTLVPRGRGLLVKVHWYSFGIILWFVNVFKTEHTGYQFRRNEIPSDQTQPAKLSSST